MASEITEEATRTLTTTADDQHQLDGAEIHRPLEPTQGQPDKHGKQTPSLLDLVAAFKKEHEACQSASRQALGHAIAAGEILLKAKNAREFALTGGFRKWVQQNCLVSVREAERYVELAKHRGILEEVDATRVSHWSIRGALRLIAEAKKRQAAGDDESPAETENDHNKEKTLDPAAMAHIDRCQKVRDLMKKRKMKADEADLRMLVGRETRAFVDEVVTTARRISQRMQQGRFDTAGYDAETIAMLLLRMAAERLRPEEAFAPSRQKGEGG